MSDNDDSIRRIADALDRIAPLASDGADWLRHPAYVWEGRRGREIAELEAPSLDQLCGIDAQKLRVVENIERHASGHSAHDMLLWGARGMGKSALVRAATLSAQADGTGRIALVQVTGRALDSLPGLFATIRKVDRRFVLFLDDLGFAEDDPIGPQALRSLLEGGVDARPANVRIAATSNRRVIVPRQSDEQDGSLNQRDTIDDKLALADRFGLSIGFHNCNKDTFLEIVDAYAAPLGLEWDEDEALAWTMQRGARSGRTAWQFVTELAGRAGKTV